MLEFESFKSMLYSTVVYHSARRKLSLVDASFPTSKIICKIIILQNKQMQFHKNVFYYLAS
jgi:hypothetical protein